MKKGQLFSLDFTASLLIVLFGLFLLSFVWFDIKTRMYSKITEWDIEKANEIASVLLTEGLPKNWHLLNKSEINQIGLISNKTLDPNKVNRFCNLTEKDSAFVKYILNCPFDYQLIIQGMNISCGKEIEEKNYSFILNIQRIAICKDRLCRINMIFGKK